MHFLGVMMPQRKNVIGPEEIYPASKLSKMKGLQRGRAPEKAAVL
jgi:hypothetical protein